MGTEYLTMEATVFAERLAGRFDGGSVAYHPKIEDERDVPVCWLPRGVATARGRLNLSHQEIVTNLSSEVHICVRRNWQNQCPCVRAFAPWVRRLPMGDPDWHFKRDGSLCYVLNREWEDFIASVDIRYGHGAAIDAAVEFCLNNTRWLLYKYVEAARRNLQRWDPAWKAWGHRTGICEYLQEKQKAA